MPARTLSDLEREAICEAVARYIAEGKRRTEAIKLAAKDLGKGWRTIYRRLAKYDCQSGNSNQ